MASYNITHSCGHDQEHQLYGPGKDRERRLKWMSSRPCTICWQAEQRQREEAIGPTFLVRFIDEYDPLRRADYERARSDELRSELARVSTNGSRHDDPTIERLRRKIAEREKAEESALLKAPAPAMVELLALDSHSVKDRLADRGWSYSRDALSLDILGSRTKPGWLLTLPVTFPEPIVTEIGWIQEQGWRIAAEPGGDVQRLFNALLLGRPELLPGLENL